jgi:hypothetical protein
MEKKVLVTFLMLLVFSAFVLPGKTDGKTMNYKKIEAFMLDYFNAFNLYAQDAATIDKMDEYWAPEFFSVQYLPLPQYPVMDLVTWKNFMVFVHLNVLETLTIEEMSIDTETMSVVARISINFNDRFSGALMLHVDGIAFYNLKVDEQKKLKITCLRLYFADPVAIMQLSGPPPGI